MSVAQAHEPSAPVAAPLRLGLTFCPLCGLDKAEPVAVGEDSVHRTTPDTFLVVSCPACGLLYLNPRPFPEDRARLYPAAYFQSPRGRRSEDAAAAGAIHEALGDLVDAPLRALEVGYGARLHLSLIRQQTPAGSVVEAVTPHEPLIRVARSQGFVVHAGDAESLRGRPGYDMILLLSSLEHRASPVEELSALRDLLRPSGKVVLLTPNAESAVCRWFGGRHWAGYDSPRHQCLFGPRALRSLAAWTGFEIQRLDSVGEPSSWAASTANLLQDWRVRPLFSRIAASGVLGASAVVGLAGTWQGDRRSQPRLRAVLRRAPGGLL